MQTLVKNILEANASTFSERNEIHALTESQVTQVEHTMVSNLYKSAVEKSYIDFDDIPDSKGDVTKYVGYKTMVESLDIVDNLSKRSNTKIKEAATIKEVLRIVENHREYFIKGFLTNNTLVTMIYNSLVASCVEATSVVIASYVEFVRDPNKIEFKLVDTKHRPTRINITVLEEIVEVNRTGKFTQLLKTETTKKDNFVGADAFILTAVVIGAGLVIIPLIRELIFSFYYTRVKISEYLDHQQELIAMNRTLVEASTLPAKEKRTIIAKQQRQADKIGRFSDKIRIEVSKGQAKAGTEMKQESRSWTLKNVQTDFASTDANGFNVL